MTAEESTAVNGSTLRALWMALKKNTKLKRLVLIVEHNTLKPWKNRFRQFHGQVLPPVRVDLPAKLAFLSATCGAVTNGERVLSVFQRLDQRAVSLVFEFAATRAIRSVIICLEHETRIQQHSSLTKEERVLARCRGSSLFWISSLFLSCLLRSESLPPDNREDKRPRVSAPDTVAWDFLSPWFEQLKGRPLVTSDGYVQVLDPCFRPAQNRGSEPKQYATNDWRTREALELLVVRGNDTSPFEEMFRFACERDREVPLSPRFRFQVEVGNQKPGELSPVTKWRNFFLSHTSDYRPSPEFLEARQRILTMQDEKFMIHPRVPRSIEVPVSLDVGSGGYGQSNAEFVGHMWELQKLINDMKSYHALQVGNVNQDLKSIRDCARAFTYRLDLLSVQIVRVDMTEACVESVLRVLGTGIRIETLEVNAYHDLASL
ncbi:hypothetical protein PHYSODRAFT_294777 [Phytophthora sojae]|uniref:Uncharacterized protein n=1 Tax=Phytophthora sojae (strain P6497) TaxID=1094619 RepID=G4YL24_PHYSP|nr:hypothetical protein PHYSODRAFT_294777 [Phytophthora sojae]EGZ29779.1 hypothetical protein PHYSODRAFT_294777 [Phytophthora sojae]|eukprot:XP_009517054.1 hypothetical protein PHYSODRAFT_294777 [Phytophthora sojae]